jgi:hypothetical protein
MAPCSLCAPWLNFSRDPHSKAAYPLSRGRPRGVKTKLPTVHNCIVVQFVVGLFAVFCVVGCEKRSGEAVVLAKEHIAAASLISETPSVEHMASPNERPRPISGDEITVDGYVMKPEVRGTEPRSAGAERRAVACESANDHQWTHIQCAGRSIAVRQIKRRRPRAGQIPRWQI